MPKKASNNEGFEILEEFVCEAIPGSSVTVAMTPSADRSRAENEGMNVLDELDFDASGNFAAAAAPKKRSTAKALAAKPANDGAPPTVVSVRIDSRKDARSNGDLGVTVIAVALTEFAKALVGKCGKQTWEYLLPRLAAVRTKSAVEVVYTSRGVAGVPIDVVLRYPSTKALKEDKDDHPIYLAMATACSRMNPPKPGESVSLLNLLPAGPHTKPHEFVIRRHAKP